ncbi:hypothetical protein MYX07_04025 [Patescibacteria group bacterium AH-259-L07]|nr:hypothetical protein [Patescibacteria group bacterium AH-259-L07]
MDPLKDAAQFTGSQIATVIHKIRKAGGSEAIREILADRKKIIVEDIPPKFFDKNGRLIPSPNLTSAFSVPDPDRAFYLKQPEINYKDRLERLQKYFPEETIFPSADGFEEKSNLLIEEIQKYGEDIANILKGTYLPICLPGVADTTGNSPINYHEFLHGIFLAAMEKILRLSSTVKLRDIFPATGEYDDHLDRMKKSPTIGIYFPYPLQGYSIDTADESLCELSEHFVFDPFMFTGITETVAAIIAYPEILLALDIPSFSLAGLAVSHLDYSPCIKFKLSHGPQEGKANLFSSLDKIRTSKCYADISPGLLFVG